MIAVTLIDHMGSDLSVVNAARVSFGKTHKAMTEGDISFYGGMRLAVGMLSLILSSTTLIIIAKHLMIRNKVQVKGLVIL